MSSLASAISAGYKNHLSAIATRVDRMLPRPLAEIVAGYAGLGQADHYLHTVTTHHVATTRWVLNQWRPTLIIGHLSCIGASGDIYVRIGGRSIGRCFDPLCPSLGSEIIKESDSPNDRRLITMVIKGLVERYEELTTCDKK